jgi:hypothetical protein
MSDQPGSTSGASAPKPLTPDQQRQRQIQAFLRAPVPKIYANGIGTALTASDISIILLDNGNPSGIVSMSYTTAKSLAKDVQTAIENFEKKTGERVKDIKELSSKMQESKDLKSE